MAVWMVVIFIVGLSLAETIGDTLIKYSGDDEKKYMLVGWLVAGVLVYMLAAFGWFFVMKHVKLGSLGVIYAVSTVTFLVASGIIFFDESYTRLEILGIVLGFMSLFLLARAL